MMDFYGYSYLQILETDKKFVSAGRAPSLSRAMRRDRKIKHFCQDALCPEKKKKMHEVDDMVRIDSFLFCKQCGRKRIVSKPQILEI